MEEEEVTAGRKGEKWKKPHEHSRFRVFLRTAQPTGWSGYEASAPSSGL